MEAARTVDGGSSQMDQILIIYNLIYPQDKLMKANEWEWAEMDGEQYGDQVVRA